MFREKDPVTDVYSKIRRQRMPYLPVNRLASSEQWDLVKVFIVTRINWLNYSGAKV